MSNRRLPDDLSWVNGPMLLHASRLVVPRGSHEAIDVTAPLPDYFEDWRDVP